MEDAADTPRVCEACGGGDGKDPVPGCPWCTDGFQDSGQQVRWRAFRQRMSKISGTYSIFQGLVEDVIDKLGNMPEDEAQAMGVEGREILCRWLVSEHGTQAREEAGRDLVRFHKRFLDYVVRR